MRVPLSVFACYSAACRPPTSGGTGGSTPGGVGGPYSAPPALPRITEAIKDARNIVDAMGMTGVAEYAAPAERAMNAAGALVRDVIEFELRNDEGMERITRKLLDAERRMTDGEAAVVSIRKKLLDHHGVTSILDIPDDKVRAAYHNTTTQMRKGIVAAIEEQRALKAERVERRAMIIAANLNVYQPMGGKFDGVPGHRKTEGKLSTAQSVDFASRMYPTKWIEASNARAKEATFDRSVTEMGSGNKVNVHVVNPLVFKMTTGRAHYNDMKLLPSSQMRRRYDKEGNRFDQTTIAEITLDGTRGTAVHEVFHRMEATVPHVRAIERAFLERRSGGDMSTVSLSRTLPGHGYSVDERHVAKANLFHPYASKVYTDSTEVGSMGWEYYATGKTFNDKAPDADHVATVLGLLVTG